MCGSPILGESLGPLQRGASGELRFPFGRVLAGRMSKEKEKVVLENVSNLLHVLPIDTYCKPFDSNNRHYDVAVLFRYSITLTFHALVAGSPPRPTTHDKQREGQKSPLSPGSTVPSLRE